MRILDRYLAKEILLPFAAGLLFLTQALLVTQLLTQADVLFGAGVSLLDVLRVVVDITPHFLSFVLPVAFLLGCTLGVGRLADDREVVAISAAGISPARLVKVPLLIGLATATAALFIVVRLEPDGTRAARLALNDIIKKNVAGDVKPGVFFDEIPNFTLYAQDVDAQGHWHHVLISDRSDGASPVLALAQGGHLEPEGRGAEMRLVLDDGEVHRESSGDEYVLARFRDGSVTVGVGSTLGERNRYSGLPEEIAPDEMLILADRLQATDPQQARRWRSLFHRKIAGPLAILAFALIAVPIAASRRGGRAFGYAATLLTVVLYYALMRFGEGLSQKGSLPVWLGPNLANVAAAALGLGLLGWLSRRGTTAVRA